MKSMLPILLEFVTAFDVEIPKLVQSESVHDLRAVTLQENVNTILKKLLKSWFNKVQFWVKHKLHEHFFTVKLSNVVFL